VAKETPARNGSKYLFIRAICFKRRIFANLFRQQIGLGDGAGHTFEFAGALKSVDEIAEGIKRHTRMRLTQKRATGNCRRISFMPD
jgi:hypothetical protein